MVICTLRLVLCTSAASSAHAGCTSDAAAALLWGGMGTVTCLWLSATARVRKAPGGVARAREDEGWAFIGHKSGSVWVVSAGGRAAARIEATAEEG